MNMLTNDSSTDAPTSTVVPTNVQILGVLQQGVLGSDVLCDKLRELFQGQADAQPQTLEQMEQEVYDVNEANGWFEAERTVLEGHMLIVSEVAEGTEAYRDWKLADMTGVEQLDKALTNPQTGEVLPKPLGVGSEYADVLVRLLDQCRRDGINLRAEFVRKLAYNRLRGYLHGGKHI